MKNCGILGRKNGFSLIEMSVVIIIIGLITAAAFSMLTANLEITQYTNTKAKLNTIVTALQRFYAANNRLPCPAQGTLKLGDATYGQEIFSGLCDRAVTAANNTVPAGTYAVDSGGGNWVRQGAIPTRALSLPDSMMYDDYGNKFSYAVTEKFTTSSVAGVITVNDGKGNSIATNIAMVVFSHGRDAKGAYNAGGTMGIACDAGVHLDKENCDADAVFTDTTYNASVDGANWYDDAIVWADKNLTINLLPAAFASGGSSASADCGARTPAHGYRMFITDETWCPPSTATYPLAVKAVAVGGGGGAFLTYDNSGVYVYGGGSGYVVSNSLNLADSQPVPVVVGKGGKGGTFLTRNPWGTETGAGNIPAENGRSSFFGGYILAGGGSGGSLYVYQTPTNGGGSGGGMYYGGNGNPWTNTPAGANGSNGYGGGQGSPIVSSASTIRNPDNSTVTFSQKTFYAGVVNAVWGGGGAGLVISGTMQGNSVYDSTGFGAGGTYSPPRSNMYGADGVVYIEW